MLKRSIQFCEAVLLLSEYPSEIIRDVPALTSCPLDYQRKFGADLLHSRHDAMITVIFNLLPNLESLTLEMNHCCPSYDDGEAHTRFTHMSFMDSLTMSLIDLSTRPSLAGLALLDRLTRVHLQQYPVINESAPRWDFNLVSFFLRLPAMTKFSA